MEKILLIVSMISLFASAILFLGNLFNSGLKGGFLKNMKGSTLMVSLLITYMITFSMYLVVANDWFI